MKKGARHDFMTLLRMGCTFLPGPISTLQSDRNLFRFQGTSRCQSPERTPVNEDAPYPSWVLDIVKPGAILDEEALMRSAIDVAMAGIRETGGGPFGAVIATGEGRVISIGTNLVLPWTDSTAHAEIVAIRRAERALESPRLRGAGLPPLTLWTTCAPCLMCVGAIHWAGVPRVVAAARKEDAEAAGFIEGPGELDAASFLRGRGIEVREDFLREEAREIFRRYHGPIYNG